jgi:hypothetical protein
MQIPRSRPSLDQDKLPRCRLAIDCGCRAIKGQENGENGNWLLRQTEILHDLCSDAAFTEKVARRTGEQRWCRARI